MSITSLDSELLDYLIAHKGGVDSQLPPLSELSEQLGINIGKLREQLEVARSLGLVEVRPRTGIRLRPFDFLPAVRLSLLFAVSGDRKLFEEYTALRNHLEIAFWHQACQTLTGSDLAGLQQLVDSARAKLNDPASIRIPHPEHRAFHMGIFAHVENPFVIGLLEAYWEAYEAVELNTYADLHYWQEAWNYHQKILENIQKGDFDQALQAFIDHTTLLRHRGQSVAAQPAALGLEATKDETS
jgi:DNA-binding FadR family transcriptional regulator